VKIKASGFVGIPVTELKRAQKAVKPASSKSQTPNKQGNDKIPND
jgi:hypothetical protein